MTTVPTVLGLSTAVPDRRYSQAEILAYFVQMQGIPERRVRRIFEGAAIDHRHFVIDDTFYTEERTTEFRNKRYVEESIPLGAMTIQRCLDSSGYRAQDIDDFIVVSCTGVEIPGLDLVLAGQLGMRPDLRRTCILGMGCYAAFPGLLRAQESVNGKPGRIALVLALELCSLHFQFDTSLENVIASALFSDGASAVLVGTPNGEPRFHAPVWPKLIDSATHCAYNTFEHMSFGLTDHGFRMRLSTYVPDILAAQIEPFVDNLLARNGLQRQDVRFWGIHPGGSKILDYLQTQIGLSDEQMFYSRAVLRQYGNMSSPTILFVLNEIQCYGKPAPGDYGVLMAFGPGLTMEGLLIQW
ncbi:MAG: type III polyketide synthase [Anaerolineae bacterium]|nr:type III polyketide synthase [Anaerolineae bacterium]